MGIAFGEAKVKDLSQQAQMQAAEKSEARETASTLSENKLQPVKFEPCQSGGRRGELPECLGASIERGIWVLWLMGATQKWCMLSSQGEMKQKQKAVYKNIEILCSSICSAFCVEILKM